MRAHEPRPSSTKSISPPKILIAPRRRYFALAAIIGRAVRPRFRPAPNPEVTTLIFRSKFLALDPGVRLLGLSNVENWLSAVFQHKVGSLRAWSVYREIGFATSSLKRRLFHVRLDPVCRPILFVIPIDLPHTPLSHSDFNSPRYQIPAPVFLFSEMCIPFLQQRCCTHVAFL
jgi:hypothetical protein